MGGEGGRDGDVTQIQLSRQRKVRYWQRRTVKVKSKVRDEQTPFEIQAMEAFLHRVTVTGVIFDKFDTNCDIVNSSMSI